MKALFQRYRCVFLLAVSLSSTARATTVPAQTFEEITDRSEFIVAGQVTRSWSDWDGEHKFIWTHHELAVSSAQKGKPGSTIIVSELGGVAGDRAMSVAGTVSYRPGDQVVVFLERMPNGYLRTAGWSQGKYLLDPSGRLHAEMTGAEVVAPATGAKPSSAGTPLRMLEGMGLMELRARIAVRLTTQRQGDTK